MSAESGRTLFNLERMLTPAERRKLFGPGGVKRRGHAGQPGHGPEGETCKSCANLACHQTRASRRFYKCGLVKWTFGPATDIRLRDPACQFWKKQGDR